MSELALLLEMALALAWESELVLASGLALDLTLDKTAVQLTVH